MGLTTTRQAFAAAIADPSYIVYRSPKESNTPPCVVLVPENPYITFPTLHGSRMNFRMTLAVAMRDDEAALGNLETLIETVGANMPAGAIVGDFSAPTVTQVGAVDVLTTQATVEITTT